VASSTQRLGARTRTGRIALAISGLGTAASAYLTYEHFTSNSSFACPESRRINCAKVTTSHWSHLLGIPVALLGLVFFAGMLVLCLPPLWRDRRLDVVRVGATAVGMLTALYLIWAELFRIDAICLWCTFVHACTLALLALVLWRWIAEPG
jgi:uncharacterized membrane protein